MTRNVVVVGGGISGLAAAYYLGRAGLRVTVLEKSPQMGGLLRVSEVAGLPVDEGAESLLNRRPEAVALARDVGLGDDIALPADAPPAVWSRGALHRLPSTALMGVPGDPGELAGLLDAGEVDRVAAERTRPGLPLGDGDVAIGRLVAERMGPAVAERLVEPLLGGVYAGYADELSLEATVPPLAAMLRRETSLLAAVAAARAGSGAPDVPLFAGIRGGVGRLAGATARASGAVIRTGVTVRGITMRGRTGAHGGATPTSPSEQQPRWLVETGPAPHPEFVPADAVVVAVPAVPAARLLRDAVPAAAAELSAVETASVGIVTLALPTAAFPELPTSSGFLVPPVERRVIKAVTFSSAKWPWLGELAGDVIVLRASVGRHRSVADLQHSDDELIAAVLAELGEMLGVTGAPVDARVTRWGGALPQYNVGHAARMAGVRSAVDQVPGLAVCGAAYEGVGVAACIASAESAATSVLTDLGVVPLSRA